MTAWNHNAIPTSQVTVTSPHRGAIDGMHRAVLGGMLFGSAELALRRATSNSSRRQGVLVQWGQVMLRRCCGSVWQLWRERAQHSDDCARCVRQKHYWESMFWIDRSHILAIHEFLACCEGRFNVNLRQYWRTYIKDTKTEMAILA